MKSFSNSILVFMFLILILPFGGRYLHSQSGDSPELSQPEPQRNIFEADFGYERLWRLMDADQDGLVTQDEWQRIFANHDENGDNRLSKSEMQSIPIQGKGDITNTFARALFNVPAVGVPVGVHDGLKPLIPRMCIDDMRKTVCIQGQRCVPDAPAIHGLNVPAASV